MNRSLTLAGKSSSAGLWPAAGAGARGEVSAMEKSIDTRGGGNQGVPQVMGPKAA